jgi:hypothetical protein
MNPGVVIRLQDNKEWNGGNNLILNIVSCMSDYRRGLDLYLDLLNPYRTERQL